MRSSATPRNGPGFQHPPLDIVALFEGFPMNPLSKIAPKAKITFDPRVMGAKTDLAAKVAECIAEYAEIEYWLGVALVLILGRDYTDPEWHGPLRADAKVALSMYLEVENHAAQVRMLKAAAAAGLPPHHVDVLDCVLSLARAVMKERNKLAHWNWGWSLDVPDGLLLIEPTQKLSNSAEAFSLRFVEDEHDHVFVLTGPDLDRMIERFHDTRGIIYRFAGTLWPGHPAERARALEKLLTEPRIGEALSRLHERRKNSPPASP
jgi:hypothetical protein